MRKLFISLIIVLLGIMFLPVYAAENVNIESIELDSKSDTTEIITDASYSGLSIKFDLKFKEVNDYIKYKIVINNPTNEDYELSENNNNSNYIKYEYSYDDGNKIIEKNKKSIIYITIKYNKEVTENLFDDEGNFIETNNLVINLGGEDIINPNTGNFNPIIYILILLLLLFVIYIITKSKKILNIFIITILLLPISIYAIEKLQIKIESKIKIEENLICNSFEEDDWSTISKNVKRNNTSCYQVGDTKEVELEGFGTHTVRISNMSTPDECSTEGFSQTACGFVVEFENIIIRHKMNSFNNNFSDYEIGNGNMGGWENSEGRAYVSNNIYNSLPSSLKNIIINTTVVSGHGREDANNFTTTDKIYLLSEKEVINTPSYDTAGTYSRQLDYYAKKVEIYGNIASSYAKRYNGVISDWWLRTPSKHNVDAFSFQDDGSINAGTSSAEYGLSPAFRIG